MQTLAVVLKEPESIVLSTMALPSPEAGEIVVDIEWSGISTGTERLLYSGRMPHFPGLGYPLVPGYESVGRVTGAGYGARTRVGERVFVPGAKCFGEVRGLFGGAAQRVVVPESRVVVIDEALQDKGVLLALAATAYHAITARGAELPDLIVGHGVLGRLIARLTIAAGGTPAVVWERNPDRRGGAGSYPVIDPACDRRRDYKSIYDVSGDSQLLDTLIASLAPGGEIVLAGFYEQPLTFSFPPAFMREARIRIAAEWKPSDLTEVRALIESGRLSLDGLITHHRQAQEASEAYRSAFNDPHCLKMVLDWRTCT